MAGYKVPQDVEAEDKFLGPLTFKQFLFMGGASILGYLMFLLYVNGAGLLDIVLFPMFVVCLVLAFPWSKDQPTDIWLTARIRFLFVPRKRIWDQSGVKDLVEITTPKREAHIYTDGLSQDQVKDRLGALASVVDSRGWAVRGAAAPGGNPSSSTANLQQLQQTPLQATAVRPAATTSDPDYLSNKPLANQFDSMMKESAAKKRQDTLNMISSSLGESSPAKNTAKPPAGHRGQKAPDMRGDQKEWYDNQNTQAIDPSLNNLQPTLRKTPPAQRKKTQGGGAAPSVAPVDKNANATSATTVNPGILSLSQNDDLNIETIARQAEKNDLGDEEVVISLHDN